MDCVCIAFIIGLYSRPDPTRPDPTRPDPTRHASLNWLDIDNLPRDVTWTTSRSDFFLLSLIFLRKTSRYRSTLFPRQPNLLNLLKMFIQSTSIILVENIDLLACKSCKYCIFPTGLDRHFGRKPHSLSPSERTSLLIGVEKDASLIRNKAGIKNLEIPPSFPFFYLELALYRDGIKCQDCGYITRNTRSIRDHYSEVHSWENPRKKGRPSKSTKENVPWKIEIPCQQYFPKEFGSQYFLVNPKKPWVAGASREETGFLEERASSAESRRSSRISLRSRIVSKTSNLENPKRKARRPLPLARPD